MSSYSEGQIHQLAEALQREGYTPADVTKLGQTAREHLGPIRGTHRIVDVEELAVSPLFSYVDSLKVVALSRFDVSANFESEGVGDANVGHVDDHFKRYFYGFVEEAQVALTIRRNRLNREVLSSAPIHRSLGKNSTEEVTCGQIWTLMKRQPFGQPGKLHVEGKANIFRVRDKNGFLRFVRAVWCEGCRNWHMYAHKIDDDRQSDAGGYIFSRKS